MNGVFFNCYELWLCSLDAKCRKKMMNWNVHEMTVSFSLKRDLNPPIPASLRLYSTLSHICQIIIMAAPFGKYA